MAAISAAERQRRDTLYDEGVKACTSCQRAKPLADFYPRRDGYRGLYGECRKCKNVAYSGAIVYKTKHPGPIRAGVL
jgi:hypothetical protein